MQVYKYGLMKHKRFNQCFPNKFITFADIISGDTMKLFIKRCNSADNRCFTVYDELGAEKFYINQAVTAPKNRLMIFDVNGSPLVNIRKIPIVGTNSYIFKKGKRDYLTFIGVLSKKGLSCRFYGNNWLVSGEVLSGNFCIIDVDNTVISCQKRQGESYLLEVNSESNQLYCIAASVAVNMINTVDKLAVQAV